MRAEHLHPHSRGQMRAQQLHRNLVHEHLTRARKAPLRFSPVTITSYASCTRPSLSSCLRLKARQAAHEPELRWCSQIALAGQHRRQRCSRIPQAQRPFPPRPSVLHSLHQYLVTPWVHVRERPTEVMFVLIWCGDPGPGDRGFQVHERKKVGETGW